MPEAHAPLMLSVSGLRGTFGGSLTPDVVARFAGALATYIRHQRATTRAQTPFVIALGRDGRIGSDEVAALASSALKLAGFNVIDLGVVMTPTLGFAVDTLKADAGLQVTASHNPQQWCGLKAVLRDPRAKPGTPDAAAPSPSHAQSIITLFKESHLQTAQWDQLGTARAANATPAHAKRVTTLLQQLGVLAQIKKAKFKVALDTVAGAGALHSPAFLKSLGITTIELYPPKKFPPGIFPHPPEPTREHLTALAAATRKNKAHVGFAQDPDADRLAVVDERGTYIGEEYTLVLAALALGELGLLKKGDKLAVNLSTSRMLEDAVAPYGCTVLRTAVGEANVVHAMKWEKCVFGGEGNGGVIWPRVTFVRDSFSAMALILALLAKRQQPLSKIVAGIPAYCIIKRKVDLATSPAKPQDIIDRLCKLHTDCNPDKTDGVWVNFKDQRAWLHVRASNTEPILRLIAEAPTQQEAESILDAAAAAMA